MVKYSLNNSLGQVIYLSISNHLLYQIITEVKKPTDDDSFELLIKEQLMACLSNNINIEHQVYYKINSNKSNTKLIFILEDETNIKFSVDFKNTFLSSYESYINQVEKTTLFLFPNEIKCKSDKKIYELDIEISYNKKLKPLGE